MYIFFLWFSPLWLANFELIRLDCKNFWACTLYLFSKLKEIPALIILKYSSTQFSSTSFWWGYNYKCVWLFEIVLYITEVLFLFSCFSVCSSDLLFSTSSFKFIYTLFFLCLPSSCSKILFSDIVNVIATIFIHLLTLKLHFYSETHHLLISYHGIFSKSMWLYL